MTATAADPLVMNQFDKAISLGTSCRTQYQLARERHERAGRVEPFSLEHARAERGGQIFDWVISGPVCVARCIAQDFDGVFARDKLRTEQNGLIEHSYYQIRFDHAFTMTNGVIEDAVFEAEYPRQRDKWEFLATRFRDHFKDDRPVLYVVDSGGDLGAVETLVDVLKQRRQGRPFRLLNVIYDAEPRGFVRDEEFLLVYEMKTSIDKPSEYQWQGDDADWRRMLTPFRLSAS